MKAIIGIDVSKKDFVVALITEEFTKKGKFSNENKGFDNLCLWLAKFDINNGKVCMEATGSYSEGLADFLYGRGYEVRVHLYL